MKLGDNISRMIGEGPGKAKSFFAQILLRWKQRQRVMRIRIIRGKSTPSMEQSETTCKNCGMKYVGNFCPRCGQTRKTERFRFASAVRNFVSGFLSIESGFLSTALDLIYRPGYLIRDYISGRRVRYARPFQMLFILAACYLLLGQLRRPELLVNEQKETSDMTIQTEDAIRGFNDAMNMSEDDEEQDEPNEVLQWGESKLMNAAINLNTLLEHSPTLRGLGRFFVRVYRSNKAIHTIFMLPIWALSLMWVVRSKRKHTYPAAQYNFTEHIYIQGYIACQSMIFATILMLITGHVETAKASIDGGFSLIVYAYTYRQLFEIGTRKALWWSVQVMVSAVIIAIAGFFLLGAICIGLIGLLNMF